MNDSGGLRGRGRRAVNSWNSNRRVLRNGSLVTVTGLSLPRLGLLWKESPAPIFILFRCFSSFPQDLTATRDARVARDRAPSPVHRTRQDATNATEAPAQHRTTIIALRRASADLIGHSSSAFLGPVGIFPARNPRTYAHRYSPVQLGTLPCWKSHSPGSLCISSSFLTYPLGLLSLYLYLQYSTYVHSSIVG